jgi:hypothetical protein
MVPTCYSEPHNARPTGLNWCRGRESNPHIPCGIQDFKSCASANFATPAQRNFLEFTWFLAHQSLLATFYHHCCGDRHHLDAEGVTTFVKVSE